MNEWISGVVYTIEVTLPSRVSTKMVTVRGYTILVFNQATQATQPGHLSVGKRNEY